SQMVDLRPAPFADVIGCFVQVRPAPIDLSDDPDFKTMLARARRAMIEGSDARRPFSDDIDESRRLGVVGFNYRIEPRAREQASQKIPGLTAKIVSLPRPLLTRTTQDIGVSLSQSASALLGWVAYAADCFDQVQAGCFAEQLKTVLERGVADPDRPLRALL